MTWDGTELPHAPDLLETARRTLLDEIVPRLSGDARFKALMAANAMAIAARAARLGTTDLAPLLARLGNPASLCRDIRAGRCDPGTPMYEETASALLRLAEARCRISAPKALG
ncbi:Acyl-CoA dehydrogenase [Rhodovastum atsumiense]|uniref:Acyl-CoA dehydrogenase n=1 Tax=Rhodovastum atsumiense TaxID=504468 RepID=A0A5M6IY41_9PROT|nr:DUF6285 domain-containing protein [Rhodovastum atsumiense]KAA5613191.1 acyl-CoA dehydrogenase [Rhodovastum atsumiense]CAH2600657.1 Acyl-CoA dehydrogenase [Rhodovastum atsumiense]